MIVEQLPYTTDAGFGSTARIGLVVLASDYTVENEFRHIFVSPEIDFFSARIENSATITPATLADMQERISDTVKLILTGDKLDVVAFGCTSASVVMGEEVVFQQIRKIHPGARCTTPITAAFAAFQSMHAKRIAVITPYREDVNQQVQRYIENAGYTVSVLASFNQENDQVVARIDEDSVVSAIEGVIKDREIDLVFVSCTNVRLIRAIASIEQSTGIPVTSSNHAMAWHSLRLAGNTDLLPQHGQLYERQLMHDL